MMDRDALATWVDGYVQAWQTNEPDAIARLFATDATMPLAPLMSRAWPRCSRVRLARPPR